MDAARNVFATIGALSVMAWAVGGLLWLRTALRERKAAKAPLPAPDLPPLDLADFMALHRDFARFEDGDHDH